MTKQHWSKWKHLKIKIFVILHFNFLKILNIWENITLKVWKEENAKKKSYNYMSIFVVNTFFRVVLVDDNSPGCQRYENFMLLWAVSCDNFRPMQLIYRRFPI